ncbi:MAG: hypothetical protein AB1634_14550 [Thermodesulfobacteriota bacterium]
MDSSWEEYGFPVDMHRLLDDAVQEILRHEDYGQFQAWLRAGIAGYLAPMEGAVYAPEELKEMAAQLGRLIWEQMPLPSRDFQTAPVTPCLEPSGPRPLPEPPPEADPEAEPPFLDSQDCWFYLLFHLPAASIQQAVAAERVPLGALADAAMELLHDGRPEKALVLLEPLFEDPIRDHSAVAGDALDVLLNVYDDLDWGAKKQRLIRRILDAVPRSPLRAAAYQRLASIYMDDGDTFSAWEAFRQAQRDDPDEPSLGSLEVHLLMADNQPEQARERARFWIKRLERLGFQPEEPPLDFLLQVAADPQAAFTDLSIEMAGGAGMRLLEWLRQVAARPLPAYRLRGLGHPPAGRPATGGGLVRQLKGLARRVGQGRLPSEAPPGQMLALEAPPGIREVEVGWQAILGLGKPAGISPEPPVDPDPWDPDREDAWAGFLEAHAEAFDSLDILDDLANVLVLHPQGGVACLEQAILAPLLFRARDLAQALLAERDDLELPWLAPDNRPLLRLLARLVTFFLHENEEEEAMATAAILLRLNPEDQHGVRALLVNLHLRHGADGEALAICQRFPEDVLPDTLYGQALALFRQGRQDEADAALTHAAEALPRVTRFLTAERVKEPRFDDSGTVEPGGDDQAYLYREDMRDVWQATPGAIDWVRKLTRRQRY